MVDLARKNLLHDKLRFLITVSGVAFAVTLVFVQVGLFLGLLDNASITIEHIDADLWVTSRNTPNVDFAHTFPESYVQRVRSVPGRRAGRQPDRLVHDRRPADRARRRARSSTPWRTSRRWNLPWNVTEGDLADLRRGRLPLPRRLGRASASAPFDVGRVPRDPRRSG